MFDHRPIHAIAREINAKWAKINPYANQYLIAMYTLHTPRGKYYTESGADIVLRFLDNAKSWHGDDARRIKQELNDILTAYAKEQGK